MESGRLVFDSSTKGRGRVLLFGGGGPIFRGASSMLGIEEGRGGKRPFFTSPDELLDEEYYDELLPEKKRRLTPEQVHLLESSFEAENKLEPERKCELARQLGLQPRQVAVWFQNRRARWKTKQLEQDFDRLRSSYDSLLADRDSILRDNDRLRSQVISLTQKLQERESMSSAGTGTRLPLDEQAAASIMEQMLPAAMPNMQPKAEDRLSTGTNGSAVMDDHAEGIHHHPVDSSVKSYFPDAYRCVGGIRSEEDDGVSDEGCSFYPDPSEAIFVEHHQAHVGDDGAVPVPWWFWS